MNDTEAASLPAGLVSAIHDALCSQRSAHGKCDPLDYDHTAYDAAAAVLASDWLAAARADAEEVHRDLRPAPVLPAAATEGDTP